jgi:hypothetical protein
VTWQIVDLLRAAGLDGYRIPPSGISSGFKSDVEVRLGTCKLTLESKVRSKGFGLIYKWLAGVDALVIKADRKESLVVMKLADLAHLLGLLRNLTQPIADTSAPKPLTQQPGPNNQQTTLKLGISAYFRPSKIRLPSSTRTGDCGGVTRSASLFSCECSWFSRISD